MNLRTPLRSVVVGTVAVIGLVLAGQVGVASAVEAANNDPGFAQLSACLSSAKRVEALYVMDVSGSLNATDPSGQRFDALEASVGQLSTLVDASGNDLSVEAALATFGNDYSGPQKVKDWTPIPSGGSGSVASDFRSAAERVWDQNADAGQGTNYEAALAGAESTLLDRGSSRGTCRVMLWFTDGLFDLGDDQLTSQVSEELCAAGGLIDRMRTDQISVIALALFNQAVQEELTRPEKKQRQGELQAMAVGSSAEKTCGTVPLPEGYRAGVYLPVESAGALATVFSGAIAQGRGGVPVSAAQAHPLRVDVEPGVRQFQGDIATRSQVASVVVTAPSGETVEVPTDGALVSVEGGALSAHSYGTLTTVTSQMPGSGTTGIWTIEAGPADGATTYLFSGLSLKISKPAQSDLVAGSPATLTVDALDPQGQPADLSVYGAVAPSATVTGPDSVEIPAEVSIVDAAAGRLAVEFTVPENVALLQATVSLIPTLASGQALPSVTTTSSITVALPSSFPTVDPTGELAAGNINGVAALSAPLTLRGSSEGPSQVCLAEATDIRVPTRAEGTTVGPADCFDLAAGEVRTVDLVITPAQSADGAGSATVPITLFSAPGANGQTASADVPLSVTWTMVRPVDEARRWALVIALVLMAVALPLLALWLTNRLLARFERGNIQVSRKAIELTPGGPVVKDGRTLYSAADLDWDYIGPEAQRNYPAPGAGLFTLVARSPLNPFGGPSFRAQAAPGCRVVGADAGGLVHDGRRTDVTPGLGTAYLIALTDANSVSAGDGGSIPATLVLLTRTRSTEDLDMLVRRAQERFDWPSLIDGLRRAASADASPVEQVFPATRPPEREPDFNLGGGTSPSRPHPVDDPDNPFNL